MKRLFSLLLTAGLLGTAYSALTNSSAPPLNAAGTPGQQTCLRCHSGTALNGGGGQVQIQGLPTNGYVPGQAYALTVVTTDAARARFGFELAALDVNGQSIGTLTASTGSAVRLSPATSISFLYHSPSNLTGTWAFTWTAPIRTSGTVKFYVASVAGNNNGRDTGDHVYTAQPTLVPATTMSTPTAIDAAFSLTVFPNPATDYVELAGVPAASLRTITLTDVLGRVTWQPATPTTHLDLRAVPTGRYVLDVLTTTGQHLHRPLAVQR